MCNLLKISWKRKRDFILNVTQQKLIQIPIFHFCSFLNICFVLQPLSYLYRHFPSSLIIFPLLCSGFQNQESFLWIFLYFSSHVYFMSNLNLWQFLSISPPNPFPLVQKPANPFIMMIYPPYMSMTGC